MKTLKMTTTLLALLTVLFTANVNASTFDFEDEPYINDIPFDTKEVVEQVMNEQNLAQFDFEDEAYIDDIPFDTHCVTVQCFYQKAIGVEFNFTEETYIDDIPFDTRQNVIQAAYKSAIEEVYNFSDEVYIDDIPVEIFTAAKRIENMELVFSKKYE
jgi:hypothetical protein